MTKVRLDLPIENNRKFFYQPKNLESTIMELDDFLNWDKSMNSLEFAKKMMFSHELKANNNVEGYGDDLELINAIIKSKAGSIKDDEIRKRILNLYEGYQYILKNHDIDKRHLKELYGILSNGLLDQYSISNMGDYYRKAPVYIMQNGRMELWDMDQGVDFNNIDTLMNKYFEFIYNKDFSDNAINEYIKSQIMHFYFVYIHPYFDVNGRTSRTMAMWYLLEKEAYPFIIFNRGISFKGSKYDRIIRDTKRSMNLTIFLEMMLDTLKTELEKEHIMHDIQKNVSYKLNSGNYQTLLNFLTMNGLRTIGDFVRFYNYHNDKKRPNEIMQEMIEPLLQMDIFKIDRYTKGFVGNVPNGILSLNPNMYDDNPNYLKRVKIK